jgi:hypothetical protein
MALMPADVTANYSFETLFRTVSYYCATVAVDYISAEAASVCVSPRSALCMVTKFLLRQQVSS